MTRRIAPVAGLALLVVMLASSCVTDLGVAGAALGLNDHGVVVGTRVDPPDPTLPQTAHAFKRQPGGKIVDLVPLPGDANSTAWGVADDDTAVGSSGPIGDDALDTPDPGQHAVRWDADGTVTDLGDLGGHRSRARAINVHGAIVGTSYDAAAVAHAVVFHPGAAPTVLDDLPSGSRPQVWGISDDGEAVGMETVAGAVHGVRWTLATGAATDLTPPGSISSQAYGIGPDGTIVGAMRFPTPPLNVSHIAMWAPGSSQPTDLGTFAGKATFGFAVNGDHVVAGYGYGSPGPFRAIRWDPVSHAITDLGSVGTGPSIPFAINANGTIVGISSIRAVRFVVGTGPTSP